MFDKKQKSPTNTQISSVNVGAIEAVAETRDRILSQFLLLLIIKGGRACEKTQHFPAE
ncbi:MAG: hypothetical protein ACK5RO_10795 [Pseudobdellovibrionaceae bacterium]